MGKNDTLNTVVNTLTYLDVSAANSRLGRMEADMNRQFAMARMEAYQQQSAINQVSAFRKQFDQIETAEGLSDRLRYLQTTLLLMDLSEFDDDILPDLQSKDYFFNLQKQVSAYSRALEARIGPKGQEIVRDILQLPGLIESAKQDYVAVEALNAAEKVKFSSPLFTVLLWILLGGLLVAAALPFVWDSELSQMVDGETTYLIAPVVALVSFGLILLITLARIASRSKAKKYIARAKKEVGLSKHVRLLSVGQSRKRLAESAQRTRDLGADSGPYAFDRTTLKSMFAGIQAHEARLSASRQALHEG